MEIESSVPRRVDSPEDPIGRTEDSVLQLDHEFRDFSNQIINHSSRAGVVGGVEVGRNRLALIPNLVLIEGLG